LDTPLFSLTPYTTFDNSPAFPNSEVTRLIELRISSLLTAFFAIGFSFLRSQISNHRGGAILAVLFPKIHEISGFSHQQ
jgi:hypothetical protein